MVQYEARLTKNAVHRGEDTNHHLLTGQLRRKLDHKFSLLLEGKARTRYTESAPFDNNLYSASANVVHWLAPFTSVVLAYRLCDQIYIDSRQLSWIGATLSFGLRHRFSKTLEGCIDYSARLKRYRRDALVQTESFEWDTLDLGQEDQTHSIEVRLESFWAGLLAEAEGRVVRNSSNSEPYRYWSTMVALSLVKSLGKKDVLEIYGSLLAKRYDEPSLQAEADPLLDPEEGKDQSALILRFIHDLTEDLSLSVYYRHLRREGRFPDRYYLKSDIGLGLSFKS